MAAEHEMVLTINVLYGDKLSVTISEHATVGQLMALISAKTGIDSQQQRLIYLGHQLKRERALSDYDVRDGVCIQLVKRELSASSPPPLEDVDVGQRVFRESYVVYLPIRVRETTILPSISSEEHILEGAPPVQRYPSITHSHPSLHSYPSSIQRREAPSQDALLLRLTAATDHMAEESHQLEGADNGELAEPSLHSLIHSYERVVESLSDFYHARRDGVFPDNEKKVIRNAIKVIGDMSTTLSARLSRSA